MTTRRTQPARRPVQMAEPALHICRFPVPAAKPFPRWFSLPFAPREPWEAGALSVAALHLPEPMMAVRFPILPDDIDAGTLPFWSEPSDSPLLLPPETVRERRLKSEWGAEAFASLDDLGFAFPTGAVSAVGWWLLSKAPRVTMVERLSELSLITDVHRDNSEVLEAVTTSMRLPQPIGGPLLAHVRAGGPLLHPRAVLWILREIAAAGDGDLAEAAAWTPGYTTDADLLAHTLFPRVANGGPVGGHDVLRAVWMLHQAFHGYDDPGVAEHPDHLTSMTASLGFRFNRTGHWLSLLEQRFRMWATPDDHPNLADAQVAPSAARRQFAGTFGISPLQWLAGVWALCTRWAMTTMTHVDHVVTGDPASLFTLPLGDRPIVFSDEFVAAFREHCVSTLDELSAECRGAAPDGYQGLGTLPQVDSVATRNAPVIELPDGRLIPLGIELVAERAVDIHRLRLGVTVAGRSTGKLFEAYVHDQLARLTPRLLLVPEADLERATPQGHKCADALVVDANDYLSVEISVQTLSRKVAAGDPDAIRKMAERYQDEADQAIATLDNLAAIRAELDLPTPRSTAFLVVTDTAVAHSPTFLQTLASLRPSRSPKFLCTASDIDHLVRLGLLGWSPATAVASWQRSPAQVPLSRHLADMTKITGITPVRDQPFTDIWLQHLPRRTARGATPAAGPTPHAGGRPDPRS